MMDNYIELIILTMSDKNDKCCVAGINAKTGEWCRLVTNDEKSDGALSLDDLRTSDGKQIGVLDCVRVRNAVPKPQIIQTENYLLNSSFPLEFIRKYELKEVLDIHPAENRTTVFNGKFCFMGNEVAGIGHSLEMLYVDRLHIYPYYNKAKADFVLRGETFKCFSVTDKEHHRRTSSIIFERAIIVASIPEKPHRDKKYYKLIAAVYYLPKEE